MSDIVFTGAFTPTAGDRAWIAWRTWRWFVAVAAGPAILSAVLAVSTEAPFFVGGAVVSTVTLAVLAWLVARASRGRTSASLGRIHVEIRSDSIRWDSADGITQLGPAALKAVRRTRHGIALVARTQVVLLPTRLFPTVDEMRAVAEALTGMVTPRHNTPGFQKRPPP